MEATAPQVSVGRDVRSLVIQALVCGKDPIFKSVTLAPPTAPSGLGRLKMREIRDKDRS